MPCLGKGRVNLRFVESDIFDVRWHTPRPKWDLGYFDDFDWEQCCQPTDWQPERPGEPLTLLDLIANLNTVERVVVGGRMILERNAFLNPMAYHLDLGEIPVCWRCNQPTVAYAWRIFRPKLNWRQPLCESCEASWTDAPRQWPDNLKTAPDYDQCPRWGPRVPLPDLARTELVKEWLARRGIIEGCIPPGDYGWTANGTFVKVMFIRGRDAFVRVVDSTDWMYGGHDAPPIIVASAALRGKRLEGRA